MFSHNSRKIFILPCSIAFTLKLYFNFSLFFFFPRSLCCHFLYIHWAADEKSIFCLKIFIRLLCRNHFINFCLFFEPFREFFYVPITFSLNSTNRFFMFSFCNPFAQKGKLKIGI